MCQSYCMLLCPIFLKGISTGSFELRADRTFHEWTIFNQHPAGPPKFQTLDSTFMGLYVKRASGHTASYVLQTNPCDGRLPGVQSLMVRGGGGRGRGRGGGGVVSPHAYMYVICICVVSVCVYIDLCLCMCMYVVNIVLFNLVCV